MAGCPADNQKAAVKVAHRQLNYWYRSLDALLAGKEKTKEALYHRVRDLFSVKMDMVFYDLTSSFFAVKEQVSIRLEEQVPLSPPDLEIHSQPKGFLAMQI